MLKPEERGKEMELQDTIRKSNQDELKKLDIDTFGQIMDGFIEESKAGLAITKEEGEKEWTIHGSGCGAVIDFYIYLNGLDPIFRNMLAEMEKLGGVKAEKLVDALLKEMRKGMIAAAKDYEEGAKREA